jgi:hypothetical protein
MGSEMIKMMESQMSDMNMTTNEMFYHFITMDTMVIINTNKCLIKMLQRFSWFEAIPKTASWIKGGKAP